MEALSRVFEGVCKPSQTEGCPREFLPVQELAGRSAGGKVPSKEPWSSDPREYTYAGEPASPLWPCEPDNGSWSCSGLKLPLRQALGVPSCCKVGAFRRAVRAGQCAFSARVFCKRCFNLAASYEGGPECREAPHCPHSPSQDFTIQTYLSIWGLADRDAGAKVACRRR